jgi:acetyl esterase/lipase
LVLDIKPKGWRDSGKLLVYTHGGAYTFFSARSALPSAVVAADATGLRVISVDYTMAPADKWDRVTDKVVAVITPIQREGGRLRDMAIYGDSAGGGLVPGAVL